MDDQSQPRTTDCIAPDGTSLCLCMTPLHVLIATNIARIRGKKFDQGVYVTATYNDKAKLYASRMNLFCDRVEVIETPPDTHYAFPRRLRIVARRWRFRAHFNRLGRYHDVCVPSSINHYNYLLLTTTRPRRVMSYDDGVANIDPCGEQFMRHTRRSERVLYLLSGITWTKESLAARSCCHYTIYRSKNSARRTTYINLLPFIEKDENHKGAYITLTLVIGAAPEAPAFIRAKLAEAQAGAPGALVLRHPRDSSSNWSDEAELKIDLIAEEYVLAKLAADPTIAFRLIGADSSVLVNLAATDRVHAFTVLSQGEATESKLSFLHAAGVSCLQ